MFAEAQIREDGQRLLLQSRSLVRIGHVGDFLREQRILPPGEFGELGLLLLRLPVSGRDHLLLDRGNPFLREVPLEIPRPVFTGELFDVCECLDVAELARLLLLEGFEKLRKRGLVLCARLFHLGALGIECFALFGGFVLTPANFAVPLLFATRKVLLRFAGQRI